MVSAISMLQPINVTRAEALTPAAPTSVAGGKSFAQMLTDVAANSVDTLARGESSSIAGLQGKASLQQVVDSITAAEQSLQTVLAVRDKTVAAWLDVSRMAI